MEVIEYNLSKPLKLKMQLRLSSTLNPLRCPQIMIKTKEII